MRIARYATALTLTSIIAVAAPAQERLSGREALEEFETGRRPPTDDSARAGRVNARIGGRIGEPTALQGPAPTGIAVRVQPITPNKALKLRPNDTSGAADAATAPTSLAKPTRPASQP